MATNSQGVQSVTSYNIAFQNILGIVPSGGLYLRIGHNTLTIKTHVAYAHHIGAKKFLELGDMHLFISRRKERTVDGQSSSTRCLYIFMSSILCVFPLKKNVYSIFLFYVESQPIHLHVHGSSLS